MRVAAITRGEVSLAKQIALFTHKWMICPFLALHVCNEPEKTSYRIEK